MPAKEPDRPITPGSADTDYPLGAFLADYPDGAAALDFLWRRRHAPDGHHAHCPRCGCERRFHRTRSRASYTCDRCGLHVHPMKDTIFEGSTTPLELWFYAIYLMGATRGAISASQLQRELGVTYRTAHRIMDRIGSGPMGERAGEALSAPAASGSPEEAAQGQPPA